MNTLRPRDSFCFSHFLFPNFKRPIPAQKWILKQQVRVPLNVPLNIPKQRTKITCQCTINRRSAKLILFVSFRVRHGEKQEEQSSQNMFLLYPVVQIWQAVAPDFLNITCRMSRKYFMNNFGLSKCSEIRTLSDRRMPGETQGRWELWGGKLLPMRANHCKNVSRITEEKHNARCGLVAGMKVIGQVFLPRETYTVHYTVKRKVWAGLKPIWLVQVWRQRYLESIVLDLRVRTYTSISAFTQKDWNPPTLFFNLTSSGPYPWSILTDQSSFIVLCHCYTDSDDIKTKKVREIWDLTDKPALALSSEELTRQATLRIILVTDVYTRNIISCRDRKRIYLDKSAFILFPQNDLAPEKATCHPLSSPTQFPWLRQLWGLRPFRSVTSTEAPDLSSSATTSTWPCFAAQCSGVRPRPGEAATRLAPRGQGVSERDLENSQAAQAAHP